MLIKFRELLRDDGILVIHYTDTISDILNREFYVTSLGVSASDIEYSYDIERGLSTLQLLKRR